MHTIQALAAYAGSAVAISDTPKISAGLRASAAVIDTYNVEYLVPPGSHRVRVGIQVHTGSKSVLRSILRSTRRLSP